jgi:hypothetical protein
LNLLIGVVIKILAVGFAVLTLSIALHIAPITVVVSVL